MSFSSGSVGNRVAQISLSSSPTRGLVDMQFWFGVHARPGGGGGGGKVFVDFTSSS